MMPSLKHHVAHDVGQHDAHPLPAIVRVGFGAMHDVAWRQNIKRNGWEPAKTDDPVHSGDGSVLGAIDANWQDRGAGVLGHNGRSIIDFHQCTGHCDPPLREDDRFLVLLDVVCERLDRERLQGVHRKNPRNSKGRFDPPLTGNLRVDGKGHLIRQERPQQDRVKVRGVVGDDQDPVACLLVMFESADFDPKKKHQEPTKEFFDHGVTSR